MDGRGNGWRTGSAAAHGVRRGAASRAVLLLTAWAFGTLGIVRVQLMADLRNVPSQEVARRCGFQREGVLRSYEDRLGTRIDYVMFSRLVNDGA